MAARFVFIDHDSPLLLPPDLRDWLPSGHMVHFIMDAVKALDLSEAARNSTARNLLLGWGAWGRR